jgi:predicted tellurium resistance membrane protein TerC
MNTILSDPQNWIAFFTLCALEIVLGIDNIIFISILSEKLPLEQQKKSRQMGLLLAALMRLGLLFSIAWIMRLTQPLFTFVGNEISGRDLILILGGLFLIYKSVTEIHNKVEKASELEKPTAKVVTFRSVLIQILVLDLVGMVDHVEVMIAAILVTVVLMLFAAEPISKFVQQHPAVKVLALAFLIMIGIALVAEGMAFHFPKGYIYFAMAFAVLVEFINIKISTRNA